MRVGARERGDNRHRHGTYHAVARLNGSVRTRVPDARITSRAAGMSARRHSIRLSPPMKLLSRFDAGRFAVASAALATSACIKQPLKLTPDDSRVVLAHQSITAPNPGLPGTLRVRTLVYSSGTDKRRTAFRDSVVLKTRTVDGSALVSAPPEIAKARAKYWGFDFKKLPINGRCGVSTGYWPVS